MQGRGYLCHGIEELCATSTRQDEAASEAIYTGIDIKNLCRC